LKWFKHDTDASTDAKIKKLVIQYGAEGYAIYFHCLELIAGDINENNITFELEHDAEIIADNLKIKGTAERSGVDKVNDIMKYILFLGLFENVNGRITCFKLLKRLDTSMTSNAHMRVLITTAKENHDRVMTESCKIRLDKSRSDKKRLEYKRFTPPTLTEVKQYCIERNNTVDAESFIDYYTANGWKQTSGNSIKDWQACVRTWEKREKGFKQEKESFEERAKRKRDEAYKKLMEESNDN
jgi:hypothetical protein